MCDAAIWIRGIWSIPQWAILSYSKTNYVWCSNMNPWHLIYPTVSHSLHVNWFKLIFANILSSCVMQQYESVAFDLSHSELYIDLHWFTLILSSCVMRQYESMAFDLSHSEPFFTFLMPPAPDALISWAILISKYKVSNTNTKVNTNTNTKVNTNTDILQFLE